MTSGKAAKEVKGKSEKAKGKSEDISGGAFFYRRER